MVRKITYADAGVDRKLRARSKKALELLKGTYKQSKHGKVVRLPYGNVFPLGEDRYLDLQIEGVGTKVLVAQLAGKHDTIGVDGVAMAVNDVIRSGAKPLAVADNIHTQVSDPSLVKELVKGIAEGANLAGCVVPNGEIGDVPELISGLSQGRGFDIVVSALGEVARKDLIRGVEVNPGDAVIGLRSSGIHSNGISLTRRILFKQWGGKYEGHEIPEELEREVVLEVLIPTMIYVKPLLRLIEQLRLKAAVHVTGEAYLKFSRLAKFSKGIGFEFSNFEPQPIFELIRKTASELGTVITDEEMFSTFNMGWGFAVIVESANKDAALSILESAGVQAEQIGNVTKRSGIRINHGRKKIVLQ